MAAVVREALPADIPVLVGLGEAFFAAHGYPGVDVDWERVPGLLRALIDDKLGLVLALEQDGAVVGALIAAAHRPVFGGAYQASELGFWVSPEARGRATLTMLPRFIEWARGLGCASATLSGFCDERSDKLSRVYARYGFSPRETTYLRTI